MTTLARPARLLLVLAALLPMGVLAAQPPATPAPPAPARAKPVTRPQHPCAHEARETDERREHGRPRCERREARERDDD